MKKLLPVTILAALIVLTGLQVSYSQGPLTNALNLRVRTDNNGYLLLSSAVGSGQGPLTALGNIRLRTDSSGNLLVNTQGGTTTPDTVCLDSTNQDITITRSAANTFSFNTGATGCIGGTSKLTVSPTVANFPSNYVINFGTPGPSTSTMQITDNAIYAIGGLILGGAYANHWKVTTTGDFIDQGVHNASVGGQWQVAGVNQIYSVASDFTTAANTNLQTITGLSWTLPATTALSMPFSCKLVYSQATAAVSDSFGLQTDTVTPTNFQTSGSMETASGTTAYGNALITNTTATAVVTGTPSAITTTWNAYLDGFLENPSNASTTTVNVMVKTSTSGDVITVKRGSFCRVF